MSEVVYVDVLVAWEDAGEHSYSALMPSVPRIGDKVWTPEYGPLAVESVTWEPKSSADYDGKRWRVVVRLEV